MASLAVEDEQQEVISVLEQVRIEIFGNKYLFLNILQFVSWDAVAISRFQQTCRANREWKKKELKEFEWEWRWKKIEALVGKEKTDIMKQGSQFKGELDLRYNQITDEGCEHLAPALAKMTALKELGLNSNQITDRGCEHLAPALATMTALKLLSLSSNQITDKGKQQMREAWKNAGKSGGGLFI